MTKPTHAIVIGGSMAGLLTARVLSDYFDRVTLFERDVMGDAPESRKGQPQTHHLHALLANGSQIMADLFPGLLDELAAEGATISDWAESMRWYCLGGYRVPFTYGRRAVTMTRPLLEWRIRRRVAAIANITLRGGCGVAGLETTADRARVTGVRLASAGDAGEPIGADLVVDTSGRGSAAPRWLAALGYPAPPESQVRVNLAYASRAFRRAPDDPLASKWLLVTPEAPRERRGGAAAPVEGGRWVVTLGGWYGDHPPTDAEGFLAFARSLAAPDIADLIARSEPLGEIYAYKFPANLWRHYERLARFPEGYLVLGDAVCSFNPIYGQGMTSAAMQAAALGALLAERGGRIDRIARPFFRRAAQVIATPWQLAVGEDFRWPEASGPRPLGAGLLHRYVDLINRASHADPVVCQAFLDVMNLLAPPASLFAPRVLLRALRHGRRADPAPVRSRAALP